MLKISDSLKAQFNSALAKKKIPRTYQGHYLKWLRYYLDFCHKYGFNESDPRSLSGFIRKLEEKKQTEMQREQAGKAVHMYYGLVRSDPQENKPGLIKSPPKAAGVYEPRHSYRASVSRSEPLRNAGGRDSAQGRATQAGVRGSWLGISLPTVIE